MKTTKQFITLLLLFCGLQTWAQSKWEEVVYLKNGNVYRGIIIEQIPNESLKIQVVGGNIFSVPMTEITKITKEKKVPSVTSPDLPGNTYSQTDDIIPRGTSGLGDKKPFYGFRKGYFFQAQVLLNFFESGGRIINGYKFHRLGQLGVGIGTDLLLDTWIGMINDNNHWGSPEGPYEGLYIPIFLHYQGDILEKRISPFYQLQLGYAFHTNGLGLPFISYESGSYGGVMGGLGVGVKIQSRSRFNFRISLNCDFKTNQYSVTQHTYDPHGNKIGSYTTRGTDFLPTTGFKLGFGF